jgi:hypothetical protein
MSREVESEIKGALVFHFNAIQAKAKANLKNYFYNSVGVGEHPDIVEECIKLLEEIDHAKSCVETLSEL